jgi:hypothetical protein
MNVYMYLSFILNVILLAFILGWRSRSRRAAAEDARRWRSALRELHKIHMEGLS